MLIGTGIGYLVSMYISSRRELSRNKESERADIELEILRKHNTEMTEEVQQLRSSSQMQLEELAALKMHNSTLNDSLQNEKDSRSRETAQLQALQKDYNTAGQSLAELTTKLAHYKEMLENEQSNNNTVQEKLQQLQTRHTRQAEDLAKGQAKVAALEIELEKEKELRNKEIKRCETLQDEHRSLRQQLTDTVAEKERYKTALEKEQQARAEAAANIREMQEKHFAQFKNLAGEILEQNAGKLKDSNNENINSLLTPLREQLENLGKAVVATNETAAGNKASLEAAIKAMMEKTENLSHEAESLTLALRGNTKKQGDWGEMILERMLEESGLRKGEEYYVQENFKTEDGKDMRPDVVIKFPDNRCVIVDSKVSLTAYALYSAASSDSERSTHLSAHVASVRRHIEELAAKDYSGIVSNSISYVLMFMPNEASYMAALQADPSLPLDSYKKKIVLISPTNLLMALQLAYNLWQKERQTRNVENIIDRATKLYDKLAGVQDTLEKVGRGIKMAHDSYDQAFSQLFRGRGNYAKQLEDLRQMGISPNKRLRLEDESE